MTIRIISPLLLFRVSFFRRDERLIVGARESPSCLGLYAPAFLTLSPACVRAWRDARENQKITVIFSRLSY